MFNSTTIPQFPQRLCQRLEVPIKCVWVSLSITLGTMFLTEGWRWLFSIKDTKHLFDGVPTPFMWLTFAGLVAFVASLFVSLFAVPIWYDIEVCWRARNRYKHRV